MNDEAHREGDGSQTEQFWEGHYRKRERVWSGNANPILIEVAESLPSGTALDLGCGEGGDAVWLARLGWQVTAVDVSNTALHRAAAEATTADVETLIDFQKHDLTRSFPEGSFDLVSAQYLQSPIEFPRDRVLKRSAEAVAPGGLLLIVAHAFRPTLVMGRPRYPISNPGGSADRTRPGSRTVAHRKTGCPRTSGHWPKWTVRRRYRQRHRTQAPHAVTTCKRLENDLLTAALDASFGARLVS